MKRHSGIENKHLNKNAKTEILHLAHYGKITDEDAALINNFVKDTTPDIIEEDPYKIPVMWRSAGGTIAIPIGYLIWTFIGTGAALLLRSFIEAIGSELGKKVVDHFAKKDAVLEENGIIVAEENPLGTVTFVLELKKSIFLVIPITMQSDVLLLNIDSILSKAKSRAKKLNTPTMLLVYLDRKKKSWDFQTREIECEYDSKGVPHWMEPP